MVKYIIKVFVGLIIFVILVFAIVFGFVQYKIYKINKDASNTVDEFIKALEENKTNEQPDEDGEINLIETNVFYNNYRVIGAIEIPVLNLAYPIIDEINEESMKKGIVILYGNNLNDIGNTVLAGHAYLKGTYFSNINNLNKGDEIILTDGMGRRISYYVYDKFDTDKNDSSFYKRETNGLREITLSTCTLFDDNKRHIVLAKEKPEN